MNLDDLPVGTILMYVGDLRKFDANKWKVCGTSSTVVDLNNRMPCGTTDMNRLGKTFGEVVEDTPTTDGDPGGGYPVQDGGSSTKLSINGHHHALPVTCVYFIQKVA